MNTFSSLFPIRRFLFHRKIRLTARVIAFQNSPVKYDITYEIKTTMRMQTCTCNMRTSPWQPFYISTDCSMNTFSSLFPIRRFLFHRKIRLTARVIAFQNSPVKYDITYEIKTTMRMQTCTCNMRTSPWQPFYYSFLTKFYVFLFSNFRRHLQKIKCLDDLGI